jgi:Protein of unknown function (DUF4232)
VKAQTLRPVTAAALLCVAAAAGCASSSSSSQSQPAAPASTVTVPQSAPASSAAASQSPAAAAPSACATSSLQVKLGPSDGYAGGVDEAINFTNTSAAPCTLFGYPGVSLVSGPSRKQIGLAAKRSTTVPVKQVTLAPGATAHAVLQIVDALNYPTATCQPAKATALRAYPPNQTVPAYLPTTATTCAKPVQTLSITPVQPGPG